MGRKGRNSTREKVGSHNDICIEGQDEVNIVVNHNDLCIESQDEVNVVGSHNDLGIEGQDEVNIEVMTKLKLVHSAAYMFIKQTY